MDPEIKSMRKQLVNKILQNQGEEGAVLSEKPCADVHTEAPFQKRKGHKPKTPEQQAKKERMHKTLAWLCDTFPDCFDVSNPKPLKKHIEADIFSHLSENKIEISKRSIRKSLTFYVRQNKYHKALLENQYRFNLAGSPFEEISLTDREYAESILEIREKTKVLQQKNKNKEITSENNNGDKKKTQKKL